MANSYRPKVLLGFLILSSIASTYSLPLEETVVLTPENVAPVASAPAVVAPGPVAPAPVAPAGDGGGQVTTHKNPDGSITTITSYKGPFPANAINPFYGGGFFNNYFNQYAAIQAQIYAQQLQAQQQQQLQAMQAFQALSPWSPYTYSQGGGGFYNPFFQPIFSPYGPYPYGGGAVLPPKP